MPVVDSSRHACPICLRIAAAIIYRHILLGENSFDIIRTRAHEKIRLDFFSRRAIICTVYCWEKCKKCNVRSWLCPLYPSIFHFILIKYGGKICQLEPSNRICKKMEIAWEVGICADYTMQTLSGCAYCTMLSWRLWRLYTARTMLGIYEHREAKKTRQQTASGIVWCSIKMVFRHFAIFQKMQLLLQN